MRDVLLGVDDPASGKGAMVMCDELGEEVAPDPDGGRKGKTEDGLVETDVGVDGAEDEICKEASSCSGSIVGQRAVFGVRRGAENYL